MWEDILGQEDALLQIPSMGEIEVAIRVGDAEDNAIVRFVASPFIQRHEVVCSPSTDVPPPVFKNHVQVLAALGTASVLSDIGCILHVVVELHILTVRVRERKPNVEKGDNNSLTDHRICHIARHPWFDNCSLDIPLKYHVDSCLEHRQEDVQDDTRGPSPP